MPAALNFKMKSLEGKEVDLSKYDGKVVLIVNVASKCGLTPQYEQLQALHKKYAEKGLAVIGFPCNQFGAQEPGTPEEIREFCRAKYDVAFDMFAKIEVNGDERVPALQVPDGVRHETHRSRQDQLELREVPDQSPRRSCGPLCTAHQAR